MSRVMRRSLLHGYFALRCAMVLVLVCSSIALGAWPVARLVGAVAAGFTEWFLRIN